MESWINDHSMIISSGGSIRFIFRSNSISNYETQPAPPRFVNYMDSVSVASASDMLNGTVALEKLCGFLYGSLGVMVRVQNRKLFQETYGNVFFFLIFDNCNQYIMILYPIIY